MRKSDTELVHDLYEIRANLCSKYCNCSKCPAMILINCTNRVCLFITIINKISKPTTCKFCDWSPDGCLCKSSKHRGFYCDYRYNQKECNEYVNEDENND